MRKHLSYYFWRVAIGVSIGLILMFAKSNAFALSFDLDYIGEQALFNSNVSPQINIGQSDYLNKDFDNPFTVRNSNVKIITINYRMLLSGSNYGDYSIYDFVYRVSLVSDNGSWSICEIQSNNFVCPVVYLGHYTSIRFYIVKDTEMTDKYIKFQLNTTFQMWNYHESSSNSAIKQNTEETAQNTKETNDLIKSDDIGDDSGHSSTFSSWQNSSAQNGTITNLITLPITLYTSILNNINGSCSSFSLGSLYGSSLTMTCIQPSQYLGSTLWGVIDMLFSGFFIFVISKKMIKVFNNMSMLKEGDILD